MRLLSTAAVLAAGALLSACATMDGGGAAPAATFDTARLSEHVQVLASDAASDAWLPALGRAASR